MSFRSHGQTVESRVLFNIKLGGIDSMAEYLDRATSWVVGLVKYGYYLPLVPPTAVDLLIKHRMFTGRRL